MKRPPSEKGKPVKVQNVAEDLGVRYILEGGVQRSGERVRITAQLIDTIAGHHICSERYDRQMGDIFALHDEITMKNLSKLHLYVQKCVPPEKVKKTATLY